MEWLKSRVSQLVLIKKTRFTFKATFLASPAIVGWTPWLYGCTRPDLPSEMRNRAIPRPYWIDDNAYATATYSAEDVPASGYIGFAVFGTADINIQDISVQPL